MTVTPAPNGNGATSLSKRSIGFQPLRSLPPPSVTVALVIAVLVLVLVAVGPVIAPHDPDSQDLLLGLSKPSTSHLLGTDDLGRDVLSRTMVGARTAVLGPIAIAIGAMLIGSVLGLIAGYYQGSADTVIMRWADVMFALPALLAAIVIVGAMGGGYLVAVGLLIALSSPYDARIIRGATLQQRGLPYVEAARTLGYRDSRIMAFHIWPVIVPTIVANTFLTFGFAIVSIASLSFLGLGVGPGVADWGRMVSDNRGLIFDNPAAALAPAAMITLIAVSVNLIGDWVYESLADRGMAR